MSDEATEEKLEDVKEESIEPLEVIIKNQPEKEKTMFDESEDLEYENMYPDAEQIKEYEEEQ